MGQLAGAAATSGPLQQRAPNQPATAAPQDAPPWPGGSARAPHSCAAKRRARPGRDPKGAHPSRAPRRPCQTSCAAMRGASARRQSPTRRPCRRSVPAARAGSARRPAARARPPTRPPTLPSARCSRPQSGARARPRLRARRRISARTRCRSCLNMVLGPGMQTQSPPSAFVHITSHATKM